MKYEGLWNDAIVFIVLLKSRVHLNSCALRNKVP